MFDTCSFKPTNDGFPPSSGGGGGAVTSVFGRTGVVIAVAGDYTSSEITNSSSVTGTYVTDALNTLDTGKLSTTLTNGNIIVGNGSNVATPVAMSGDATIINTGALTISNQAVTFAKMQHISSQHLVGRHAAGSGDIQQISLGTGLSFSGANLQVTGFVPTTLTSANIIVGNNLGVATAVAMSGDTTISNTGAVTISNDAVTTAKILNSNVTYAKIQNATTNRLIGRATAGAGVIEEITLGTNLSFTGTTLNAAGGGGYTYLAITLSVPNTTYNKAALGGANYLFISTNDATTRTITIDSTGFVANDFLVLSFNEESLGLINLIIGTTPRTFNNNRGNTVFAVYNGTEWVLQLMASSYNTAAANNSQLAIGLGSYVNTSNSTAVGSGANTTFGSGTALGATATAGSAAVAIGSGAISSGNASVSVGQGNTGSGTNSVRIGAGTQTGANTGVVAIGQGITSTNSDNVIIGRQAGASGTNTVAIGGSVSGIGANTVAIGIGGSYGSGTSAVYIGASISTLASNSVIIGASASGAVNSVVVGRANSVAGANTVAIGDGITTSTNTGVVAIGQGITNTSIDAVVIGRAASAGGTGNVTIGANSTGTGNNCVRIGAAVTTSTATSLVALGNTVTIGTIATTPRTQNILLGNTVTVGTYAGNGGFTKNVLMGNNVTIGNFTGTTLGSFQTSVIHGNNISIATQSNTGGIDNTILIGNGLAIPTLPTTSSINALTVVGSNITFSSAGNINNRTIFGAAISMGNGEPTVAVGQGHNIKGNNTFYFGEGLTNTNEAHYLINIGRSNTSNVVAGVDSYNVLLGFNHDDNGKLRTIQKGVGTEVKHYGVESRRIDNDIFDSTVIAPDRYSENTAWNGQTTNNTITELFLFGVASERLTLQNNEILTATIQVQAKRNATTDSKVELATVSIIRGAGAGTVALVGAGSFTASGSIGTGATVSYTIDADTTNGSLRFQATGNASETWQWTANIITYTRTRTA